MTNRDRYREGSHDLLNQYLQEIARIPRLTPERERELGYRIRENDKQALEELVQANLRFVVSYAKRFRNANVHFLDLINEGNIGLIQAAKKFDPDKNVKFITYAVWWIRQAILHALSEQGGVFRLPPKRANLMYRLEKEIGKVVTEENRFPGEEELAAKLGITEKEVGTLMQAMTDSFSLNTELDNESHTEIGDLIEQTTVPPADEELEEQAKKRELLDRMDALSPKEKLILCLRHGVTDDMPLDAGAIAEFIGKERFEVADALAAGEEKVCGALEIDRVELAHLLLYLNPNPKASMTFWLQDDDDANPAGEEQLIRPDRVEFLEDLKQHGRLQTTIDSLELEERVILKLRYGIMTDELTLRDIGELLGLSRERVRQIEARAEAKCRRLVRRGRRPS